MASPLDVQLILCDSAVADPAGKIHMLGAGWSMTSSPSMHAVAVLAKIPWDRANQRLPLKLSLLSADGEPVEFDTPEGKSRIENLGYLEVGRPTGVAPGSMLDAAFVLNVPPLPLDPGRYEWRLELAEHSQGRSFTVRG